MTNEFDPDIAEGTRIAIPVKWEGTLSKCVEWRLVDWITLVDTGERVPVYFDGSEEGSWGGDFAILEPQQHEWCFPDGERCDDAGLVAAFERRAGKPLEVCEMSPQERRAVEQQRQEFDEQFKAVMETLEVEGRVIPEIGPDGVKRWIVVPERRQ